MAVNHLKRETIVCEVHMTKRDDDVRCSKTRCHQYKGCTQAWWPLERSAEIYPGNVKGMVDGTVLTMILNYIIPVTRNVSL